MRHSKPLSKLCLLTRTLLACSHPPPRNRMCLRAEPGADAAKLFVTRPSESICYHLEVDWARSALYMTKSNPAIKDGIKGPSLKSCTPKNLFTPCRPVAFRSAKLL